MTTDKSRADVLTCLLSDLAQYAPEGLCAPTALQGFAMRARAILAASPVETSRADALTDDERLLLARVNDCTKQVNAADRNGILKLIDRLAAPVEQHAMLTAQAALAAIETFEIVGESNDSREPNSDDRFILTEFIAHAFGGHLVEQHDAVPADSRYTHPGCEVCACPAGVCQSDRSFNAQPEPPAADERPVFALSEGERDVLRALVKCLDDRLTQSESQLMSRIADSAPARASSPDAATPGGYCERAGGCVCGGDLPRVRECCSEWVKLEQKAAATSPSAEG